jgi:peptidoglycan hydrolase CwlO-like protein
VTVDDVKLAKQRDYYHDAWREAQKEIEELLGVIREAADRENEYLAEIERWRGYANKQQAEIEKLRAGIKEALDYWNHHGGIDAITILERALKGEDDGE